MATYKKNNRLSSERSPYLLQHAANPVDWYPWGPEAFQKAKDDNKLIFLSVGYSTCHWCHVMERESFESCEVAKVMNDNFVCIKVDREERPDVDRIYMMFVQATTGHGGWPMSVWLTPDLKPVMGGTYFPPDGVYQGRPGFKTVLQSVAEKWQEDSGRFQEQGSKILAALKKASTKLIDSSQRIPSLACVETCYTQLSKRYDPKYGGFGQAPKFPQPVNIRFLLRMQHTCKEAAEKMDIMSMIVHTLKMMARGGMHDHVSQGFHRYSTDAKWHVPHFEKMLYDQAQLAVVYAEAYQVTQDDCFAEVCHDILRYVDRDLSNPAGGFYSAEDADSLPSDSNTEKKEGAFCVWTSDEIHQILSEKISENVTMADVFSHHFAVQEGGNVDPYQDPHDELKNKNVLMVIQSVEDTADYFEIDAKTVKQILERGKQLLYKERCKRPCPHLDDKIITAWNGNGLMISGFAKCGQALGSQEYINRAKKGADFVRNHLFDHANNCLLRSSYSDEKNDIVQLSEPINGFLDDYAFLINGLLDLYECCFDSNIIKWAEQLQDIQNKFFWDEVDGGYFSTSLDNESLILRIKDDQDGAEPCANSVAVGNLVRLANILKRDDLQAKLKQMLMLFGDRLEKAPIAVPEMVNGLMLYHSPVKQIIVCGKYNEEDTTKMMELINSKFLPDKVVILADGKEDNIIYERLELMSSFRKIDGKATAYVCKDFTCSLPVNDLQELEHLLS